MCHISSLDIGPDLCHLAVAYAPHIDPTYMPPRTIRIVPEKDPAGDTSLATRKGFYSFKDGIAGRAKQFGPGRPYGGGALVPYAVGRGRILEDTVLRDHGHEGLEIAPAERGIDACNQRERGLRLPVVFLGLHRGLLLVSAITWSPPCLVHSQAIRA